MKTHTYIPSHLCFAFVLVGSYSVLILLLRTSPITIGAGVVGAI